MDGVLNVAVFASISQLLNTTPHLLGTSPLVGHVEDVIRDEAIPLGKASKDFGIGRGPWTVLLQRCGDDDN